MSGVSKAAEGKPRSSREDVLQFLDSLDSYSTPPASVPPPNNGAGDDITSRLSPAPSTSSASKTAVGAAPVTNAEDAQSVLDFLDELTQRSSTPTAKVDPKRPSALSRSTSRNNISSTAGVPTRKSGEMAKNTIGPMTSSSNTTSSTVTASSAVDGSVADGSVPTSTASASAPNSVNAESTNGGGWGWSSVWSQASTVVQQATQAVQQARTAAEEQITTASKALGENEQAKKWSSGVIEYARGAHLDQLGKDLKSTTIRSLTDLLNAVAPPIAEHEVLQVSLSHDMVGYDGVEALVYRGLAKIMDQIEGGTLVVNKGNEEKQSEATADTSEERNLNYVEGLEEGWKMAEANLDQLIKTTYKPEEFEKANAKSTVTVPITTCPIFMRIQPCLATIPYYPEHNSSSSSSSSTVAIPSANADRRALFFLMSLRDPTHNLAHTSLSQSMPSTWLDIPFEENEWVEDVMVDIIRKSVEVIGQEYISHRMRAQSQAISKAREAAKLALDGRSPAEKEADEKRAHDTELEASEAAASARVV